MVDVDYYKRIGDYHRYVAGFETVEKQQKSVEAALKVYEKASAIAVCDMHPVHHSTEPGAQILRLLLRDSELVRQGPPDCQVCA